MWTMAKIWVWVLVCVCVSQCESMKKKMNPNVRLGDIMSMNIYISNSRIVGMVWMGVSLSETLSESMHVWIGVVISNIIGYINFWGKTPSFPKKWWNVPPKFLAIFSENTAFFEEIVYSKNIPYLICDKCSIHFWCKMAPYWSHSD